MTGKAVRIEITLSPERAKALDDARGLAPRAAWIKDAIDAKLECDPISRAVATGDFVPLAASPTHENRS